MSAQQGTSSVTGSLRGMRRKAVRTNELVQTGFLPSNEERLPLVITPAVDNVDLASWCASHAEDVERYLARHGAILFRGFPLADPPEFEAVASTIAGELFADYGDLPPEETGQRIYHSTPYPHDKMILFHNESSHFSSWPLRQFFFCVVPSAVLIGISAPVVVPKPMVTRLIPCSPARFASATTSSIGSNASPSLMTTSARSAPLLVSVSKSTPCLIVRANELPA